MSIKERLDTLSRGELAGLIAVLVVTLAGAGLWYTRSLPKPVQIASSAGPVVAGQVGGSGAGIGLGQRRADHRRRHRLGARPGGLRVRHRRSGDRCRRTCRRRQTGRRPVHPEPGGAAHRRHPGRGLEGRGRRRGGGDRFVDGRHRPPAPSSTSTRRRPPSSRRSRASGRCWLPPSSTTAPRTAPSPRSMNSRT